MQLHAITCNAQGQLHEWHVRAATGCFFLPQPASQPANKQAGGRLTGRQAGASNSCAGPRGWSPYKGMDD